MPIKTSVLKNKNKLDILRILFLSAQLFKNPSDHFVIGAIKINSNICASHQLVSELEEALKVGATCDFSSQEAESPSPGLGPFILQGRPFTLPWLS